MIMKNLYFILFLVFTSFFITSCKKKKEAQQWKLPVDVTFKMDVNHTPTMNNNLSFTGGYIVLSEFEFDGQRIEGDDAYFSKSFSGGLSIPFSGSMGVTDLNFDIPQGTYTKITILFEAEGNGGKSVVVYGNYTNSSGTTYPLVLEVEELELYTVIAKNASGSSEIILDKDVASIAKIKLDPVYWFQNVSITMLDNATLVNLNGVQTILINGANNEDIYDIVDDQIDKATNIIFD